MVPANIKSFNSFQTSFIKWAVNKRAMLLQAQPGKGKSLASVGLFLFLRQQLGYGKMLVVTARKNADAFKKANIKKLLLLTLFSKQDMAVLYSGYDFPADIYIISNTFLATIVNSGDNNQKKVLTELLKKTTVLCIDEIHGYRSYDSARTKAMKKTTDYYHRLIMRDPKAHRLIGVTATPIFKETENLYPLFNLLCSPNPLGSWKSFQANYCILEEATTYGSRRVYSHVGSHSFRDTVSFNRIVGYKNLPRLHSIVDPFIFIWNETNFKFNFNLHSYSLSPEETAIYKSNLKGLGLDKTYAIDLEVNGEHIWAYRNKADTFYLPDKRQIRTDELSLGLNLLYDNSTAVVRGVYEKSISAGFATRVVKAQQVNSRAANKLAVITELVRSQDIGVLIYFNFLESVEAAKVHLMQEFPTRRVVVLTGGTQRFNQVVASIGKNDIVLMSSVASQSLDMYIPRLIVAECFGLTPGKIEQLVGRMTRENAEYREVDISFVLRGGENVEAYFYEKLRHRLRMAKTNVFVTSDSLPASAPVANMPVELIDEEYLKKRLLWNLS